MPAFPFIVTNLAALGTNRPLVGWQYERLPWPAYIKLLTRANAVGVVLTVYSGSEAIVEESPVQAGGTAGVTPSELNTPPIEWQAAAFDKIGVVLRETANVATTDIDGIIYVEPLI